MSEKLGYTAGYKIIKLKPIDFGSNKGAVSHTCSGCLNFSVFDHWCQSWMNEELTESKKTELLLNGEIIEEIQLWTDEKFPYPSNILPDLETTKEFIHTFLNNVKDLNIYSVNFSETDANLLIEDFAEGFHTEDYNYNNGYFGLRENLIKKKTESDSEIFIGYDLIGVECDGSFHSFLCNNTSTQLIEKFSLNINKYGLFETIENPNEVRKFLNTNEDLFEPVPYYICKIKKVFI